MKVFKFRILPDAASDVFRDVEISADDSFEHLHRMILEAFEFSGKELASFYLSDDEWEKGEEIALLDLGEEGESVRSMSTTSLSDLLEFSGEKLFYLYDFMRLWIFYVELLEVKTAEPGQNYPFIALSFGMSPDEYSKETDDNIAFDEEDSDEDFEEDYGFDEDDLNEFSTFDEY